MVQKVIHLKEDAIPYKITFANDISIYHEAIGRQLVKDLCKQGILIEVKPGDPPCDWLAQAFFTENPGQPGNVRLVADFTRLNSQIDRPVRIFPTGEKIWRNVKPDCKPPDSFQV